MIHVTKKGVKVLEKLFDKHNIVPTPAFSEWPLGYAREVSNLVRAVMEPDEGEPLTSDQLGRLLQAAGVWDDPSTLPDDDLP